MSYTEKREELVRRALQARSQAYAPYSHFFVGAALLSEDGSIFEGCNVENCSYGLTVCAERSAVVNSVVAGVKHWKAIAIASKGGVTPCGACRQFLAEFGTELEIILVDSEHPDRLQSFLLSDLLPFHFTPSRLRSESF